MTITGWPSLSGDMQRLDHLIGQEILHLRTRYQLSLDEFRGLYISDAQVDRLVAQLGNPSEAGSASGAGARPSPL